MDTPTGHPPRPLTIHVKNGPSGGKKFTFRSDRACLLGRGRECTVRFPDDEGHQTISRRHCRIDGRSFPIRMTDLGSLNGTFINGRLIGRRKMDQAPEDFSPEEFVSYQVKPEDEIALGSMSAQVWEGGSGWCAECGQEKKLPQIRDNDFPGGLYRCPTCRKEPASAPSDEHRTRPASPSLCLRCGRGLTSKLKKVPLGEVLCVSCRTDPVAILQTLLKISASEPGLAPLKNFHLVRPLGQGATGAVFLVQEKKRNIQLALKLLIPAAAENHWVRESFLREVKNSRALRHPHVVRLFGSGSYKGALFYLMEFCSGGSLDQYQEKLGGRIPLEKAGPLVLQALDGLDYIHQADIPLVKLADGKFGRGKGLVHRDLKPANIFLAQKEGRQWAKIADIGVAKAFDMAGLSGLTRTGTVAGSPLAMPRQQVINFKYSGPEIDVWAMAATFYIMLTGQYPRFFPEDEDPWTVVLRSDPVPIRKRDPSIPDRVAEVIDAALVDNPEIVFKRAKDFKTALEGVL